VAIRKFSATLSPAIVATIVCAEQSFAVGPGDLNPAATVSVTKPTTQTTSVVAARVVSATNIAVVFCNPTAAGVTPTAGEVYQFSVID
jgi:hypothetical protein